MRPSREPLHLIEVGLNWPPDTFLRWKLEGLVRRGFRVTVVSHFRYGQPFSIPGVELLHMPEPTAPLRTSLPNTARDGLPLLISHPRRFAALLVAIARRSRRSDAFAGIDSRLSRRRRWRERIGQLRRLFRLAALRPDVAHFEWESTAVSCLPIADVWSCPVVISCHGGLQAYGQMGAYDSIFEGLRAAFERASAVQCVSRLERNEAIRHGLASAKARLIPCGVDPTVFSPPSPASRDGDEMRLIAVGWLRWLKGYEYSVRTIRMLLDAGVPARLDVFGGDPLPPMEEPSDRARILHTISDLELDDHVRLHGHVPSEILIDRLRSAHAFLHSSLSEGLPVVILEAMACELPVVATDSGGVREAVSHGVDGFVLPPRDPAGAAAALERLWREPELRERMGQAGRARVLSDFTLESHLEDMERLYAEVTGASGSGSRALSPRGSH
jgi:glycosyltransferase involved in cell wall biosynthesis